MSKKLKQNPEKKSAKESLKFKELEKLAKEIATEAKLVVDDYKANPSEQSGSHMYQVHHDSPYLDPNENYIVDQEDDGEY